MKKKDGPDKGPDLGSIFRVPKRYINAVIKHHLSGLSNRQISKKLPINVKTINRIVKQYNMVDYSSPEDFADEQTKSDVLKIQDAAQELLKSLVDHDDAKIEERARALKYIAEASLIDAKAKGAQLIAERMAIAHEKRIEKQAQNINQRVIEIDKKGGK